MIRSHIDAESILQKQIDKVSHERLTSPLPDLVVHPRGAKFHAVHDFVHFRVYPGFSTPKRKYGKYLSPCCSSEYMTRP